MCPSGAWLHLEHELAQVAQLHGAAVAAAVEAAVCKVVDVAHRRSAAVEQAPHGAALSGGTACK